MPPTVDIHHENASKTILIFSGDWQLNTPFSQKENIFTVLKTFGLEYLEIVFENIGVWDSSLVAFLVDILVKGRKSGLSVTLIDPPEGVRRLVDLALTVPKHETGLTQPEPDDFFTFLGDKTLNAIAAVKKAAVFFKQIHLSFKRLFSKTAVMRSVDLLKEIQDAGVNSLPIISLISFLVGLILAFVGAVQLRLFGAQIYVASLVAIAMSRVMGAVMAGIIMAGRTGASYAATIGSMQVNEEIDALETMGISPYDFLVLPRLLALALMLPLLTIYANLMSILGGAFVGVFMLDLTPNEYFTMTLKSLFVKNINIGLLQSFVFGIIVALCGCYCGMSCERNAAAVGRATTSAVVYAIVWIVVATGVITIICNALGV